MKTAATPRPQLYTLDRFAEFAEVMTSEVRALREMLSTQVGKQEDRLISPTQACEVFQPKISRPTLKKWSDDGLIPMQRIGGRVFYRYTDVISAGMTLKRYKKV